MTGFFEKDGLPKGVVNLVHGFGESAGKALTEHPAMKAIAFVGESITGSHIMAQGSPTLKRLHFELGGKNPVVVKDNPRTWGFVANRVYGAMIREAERVVAEGMASAEEVNQLMTDCFNWPVGPLALVTGARGGWKQ